MAGAGEFIRRSRAEGDRRNVPENHREGKRASNVVGSGQKATRREYPYWFQHFRWPTFRPIVLCALYCNLVRLVGLNR
jgi:hypothetical protein